MRNPKTVAVVLGAALVLLAGCSSATSTTTAADPVTGTWRGEWGPSPTRQTEVTVELKLDGASVTGTVDPERRPFEIKKGSFDSKTNAVRLELDGPNRAGETVHYVIEGKVSGATMSGTFDRAGEKGTFNIQKK